MSDEEHDEDARRATAQRVGREAGTRAAAFKRYAMLFDLAAVAVVVARLLGWSPLSWTWTIALALTLALLPPAVHGLIIGLKLTAKFKHEAAIKAQEL